MSLREREREGERDRERELLSAILSEPHDTLSWKKVITEIKTRRQFWLVT